MAKDDRLLAARSTDSVIEPEPGFQTDTLKPGDRVGEYILEEVIGVGGCGRVWKARHSVLPGVVAAIKLPRDPRLIDVLRRESLLQFKLDHPGILKVYGVDLEGPIPYLAEEFAVGGDLAALIRREGKLSTRHALGIFFEAVEILRHAHAHGIVHNDLKPANILFDADGHVHIGDFGLGRGIDLQATALASLSENKTGEFLWGTWEYMSPEQRDPTARTHDDPSNDIYALGIILYEMLRGERPAGRVDLADISPAIDDLFARCWTTRAARFADAEELAHAVDGARTGPSTTSHSSVSRNSRRAIRKVAPTSRARWFFWGAAFTLSASGASLVALHRGEMWPFLPRPRIARSSGRVFDEASQSDADALGDIRRRIESEAMTVEVARRLLRDFQVITRDPDLAERARAWESVLPIDDAPARYRVRWTRFSIDPETYRHSFFATLEPGRPDIFLRVHRVHDGRDSLVWDLRDKFVEAWSADWSLDSAAPSFELEWARGDKIIVEVWDRDHFGDSLIDRHELDGDLSIVRLSTPRRGAHGHAIELETSHGFGK
jgi:serine/threonine protein kinase